MIVGISMKVDLKITLGLVVLVLFVAVMLGTQVMGVQAISPLPGYTDIYIQCSNPEGIAFNFTGTGTYYLGSGGFNAVHVTTDTSNANGQYTISPNQSGVFYVTNTGGRVYQDDVILMIAVNGTIPDNFRVHINASGYSWMPSSVQNQGPDLNAITYNTGAVNETFTKGDFLYGPQNWKPTGDNAVSGAAVPNYPIFINENMSDPSTMSQIMFIDTHVGALTGTQGSTYGQLIDNGYAKIQFSFENLPSSAFFNVYAWNNATSHGQSMGWANSILPGQTGGPSGYSVINVTPSAPVASFTANATKGTVPMIVQFNDTSINMPTSWSWDFGDGNTSLLENPVKIYSTAGTYNVTLTASNDMGNSTPASTLITVNPPLYTPVASFIANQTTGVSPLTVQFNDTSSNMPTSWSWDFGDGNTSILQNPVHTYIISGNYAVALTAINALGNNTTTHAGYITVLPPAPVANFSANVTSGTAPLSVLFTDASTNNPTSWLWIFGDGNTSTLKNPVHTYSSVGTYAVNLTATNSGGMNSSVKVGYITVSQPAPVASFVANQTIGLPLLAIQFTDKSSNAPTSWSWDFGDGNTSTSQNPVHVYSTLGVYTVNLTVSNIGGSSKITKAGYVTVVKPAPIPRVQWNKTYGAASTEYERFAVQTSDGGYAAVGYTNSYGNGSYDAYLVKTDSNGNMQWNKTYGGTGNDYGYAVQQTSDNGYIIVGVTASFSGSNDVWLVKTDSNGNMQWNQTYGGTGSDIGYSINLTSDGGYIIVGSTASFSGSNDVWLVKTDSNGNMQWNKTYGGTASDIGYSIKLTSDGSYLILGDTSSYTNGSSDVWLLKTDSNGNVLLNKSYGGTKPEDGRDVLQTSDGGYIITGQTNSYGNGIADFWLVKTDSTGNMQWNKTYGGTGSDMAYSVLLASDGGYVLAGCTNSFGNGSGDVWLVKTDSNGNLQWNQTYGGTNSDSCLSALQTTDGGYLLGGYTQSYGNGSYDFYLIKLTYAGFSPVASFTANQTGGNAPLTVQFNDTSSNVPTSWSWDFGDGNTSIVQNPVHTYTAVGTYSVSLNATNTAGSNTSAMTGYITVLAASSSAPVANFTANTTSGLAPLTVQFNDTSSNSPTSWSWNFGDSPGNVYVADNGNSAVYKVYANGTIATVGSGFSAPSSVAVDSFGNVFVADPDNSAVYEVYANGTMATVGSGFSAPRSVAVDSIGNVFVSDPDNSAVYKVYANGTMATVGSGFSAPRGVAVDSFGNVFVSDPDNSAVYEVYANGTMATVGSGFSSPRSVAVDSIGNVFVSDPDNSAVYEVYANGTMATVGSGFSSPRSVAVDSIGNVFVADNDYNAVYEVYTNGTMVTVSSSFSSPVGVAVSTSDSGVQNPVYTYNEPGTYNVSLIVSNAIGSNTATMTNYITVLPGAPKASFVANDTSGDVPMAVQFNDTSLYSPTSWFWDFGDGSTSNEQNPIHTYTVTGFYNVSLYDANSNGTSNTFVQQDYIKAYNTPVANFSVDKVSGVDPIDVQFTDTSANTPTSWFWDFGDGTTSTQQNPAHWYTTGTYAVNLTVSNGGANSSLVRSNYITVNASTTGNRFTNPGFEMGTSDGWIFGTSAYPQYSGTTITTNSHSGQYAAHFGFMGGSDTNYLLQYVDLTNVSNITFWGTLEGYNQWPYGFAVSIDGVGVGGGTPRNGWTQYMIPISNYTGVHSVEVSWTSTASFGADLDDFSTGPATNFTVNTTYGTAPLTVQFNDTSLGAPTSWLWDFGDNTTSSLQNPVHTYSVPGNYTVSLNASNAGGWNIKAMSGYITVLPAGLSPVASFTANTTSGRAPLTVLFTDNSTNLPTSWLWDFGDGNTSSLQNPVHMYSVAGNYTVSLTACNANGNNTMAKANYISPLIYLGPLSANNGIYFYVANDEGVKYDLAGNNEYYVARGGGGLNPIQLSTDPSNKAGQITTTTNQSGTFYVVFSGGISHMDDGVLMLAVNGSIPDDFSVNIKSSGYNWTPAPAANSNPANPTVYNYVNESLNETFYKSDFIYGPQSWKPANTVGYGIFKGENQSDPANQYHIMFIDLRAGAFVDSSMINSGSITVEYSFHNLTSFAAFDDYGWFSACNWGTGIPMTNNIAQSGYNVVGVPSPVASFTSNVTTGVAPLAVQFNDTSSNSPTSWNWSFGDGSAGSNLKNPVHTYSVPGTYDVSLNASNAAGSNTKTIAGYVTVSQPAPILQFSGNNLYDVSEDAVWWDFQVSRTNDSSYPVTVDYRTSDGTAVSPSNYGAVNGTLTFNPGVMTQTFRVYIENDHIADPNLLFNITLSNSTGGAVLGPDSRETVTIHNSGYLPTLQFNSTAYSVSENGGFATLNVVRDYDASYNVSVDYMVQDGSAKYPADYSAHSGTLTFTSGAMNVTFQIPIVDDGLYGGNKDFTVALGNPSPGGVTYIGLNSIATVTMVESDPAPVLRLSDDSYSVDENAGTATITVVRANDAQNTTAVDYSTADGSATAGINYVNTTGTVYFARGEMSKTFTVPILQDGVVGSDLSFTVKLGTAYSSPAGAMTGSPSQATVTIHNMDNPSPSAVPYPPMPLGWSTGSVTGRVTTQNTSNGIGGAYVAIVNGSDNSVVYVTTTADAGGYYTITGVNSTIDDNAYQVYASLSSYGDGYSHTFGINSNATSTTSVVIFTKPSQIQLTTDSPSIYSDGLSYANITASVTDFQGNSVADGYVINFAQSNTASGMGYLRNPDDNSLCTSVNITTNGGYAKVKFGWATSDGSNTIKATYTGDNNVNSNIGIQINPVSPSPVPGSDSFVLNLKQGWNLVSIPLVNGSLWADQLQGTGVVVVASYNKTSGGFNPYVVGVSPASDDIQISMDNAYYLLCSQDTSLTIMGSDPSSHSITLTPGWNMVGWSSLNSSTAKVVAAGIPGDQVFARYNSSTNGYDPYVEVSSPDSDTFALSPGVGYFILSDSEQSLTYGGV